MSETGVSTKRTCTQYKGCGANTHLRSVMVEDDGAEVPTVVMLDKVFCRIGDLETACSEALLLQESLIQSKDHLREGEREEKTEFLVSSCLVP